jgi:internalin A
MSSQPDPVPHPWRRFLRFSVRGLIVVVLVIGAGLGWIVHVAHVQRDAVAAIKKAGGTVQYDWESSNGKPVPGGKPWAPRWLVDLIGVDFFGHVTVVSLNFWSNAPDTALVEVRRLNHLQILWLGYASFSDAELVSLKELTNLSVLGVEGTRVTDAGLAALKGLTKLSDLHLGGTQITDAGLVHLKGLTKLSVLLVDGTRITDAGLVHLKGLTKLKRLALINTGVTDAGVKELERALPNVTIIR